MIRTQRLANHLDYNYIIENPDISIESFLNTLLPHKKEHWDRKINLMKAYKKYLKNTMLVAQNYKCAYCGIDLRISGCEREHIADKATYENFTFEKNNLVLTCFNCNHAPHKGTKNVVIHLGATYRQCSFLIIHPYFDDPEYYYDFVEDVDSGKNIIFQIKAGLNNAECQKAYETIKMFELNSEGLLTYRMKEAYASISIALSEELLNNILTHKDTL